MTARLDPERVLAVAKESPLRVAQHDKAGWLALFSPQAVVEDPVGAAPHQRGAGPDGDPLSSFYETFIAKNDIHVESSLDAVAGGEVARDVLISTKLVHGAKVNVPTYLRYQIVEENGALRIAHLQAHWEVKRMSWQVMTSGLSGLLAMNAITFGMLRHEGLSGVTGYMRGMLHGIGGQGTKILEKFAAAVRSRDAQELAELFVDHDGAVEWPIGTRLTPSEFLSRLPAGTEWSFERPQNSGFVSACRYALSGEQPQPGIAFFEIDPESRRIRRARLFVAS
jgi:hypothetical protein